MIRIACVGGFLGAGKTTALIEAARRLMSRGLRVGIITNDQGSHLVDTEALRRMGIEADEITGGCFCCRFQEFVTNIERIVERNSPDIILAEAVGSCMDLAATVYRPLKKYYADRFALAPLSVFVEPARVEELFFGSAHLFEESVRYLFRHQLAEAEWIVLNKCDLVDAAAEKAVIRRIEELAGKIPILRMSARTGQGVDAWIDGLSRPAAIDTPHLQIDYEIYGKAEASLGWLNATVDLVSPKEFSPIEFGEALVAGIQDTCRISSHAIAHLKILLASPEGSDRIAVTATGQPGEWSHGGSLAPAREVSVIVNARVSASPNDLKRTIEDSLAAVAEARKVRATVQHLESFAPPPPNSPYRVH